MQKLLHYLDPLIQLCTPDYRQLARQDQRRVLLVIAGTLIACAAALPVTLLLIYLESYINALTSALSVIPMLMTLIILRATHSTNLAGHYLTLIVTIAVAADLGPDNGFSIVAMLAIPILSSHIMGARAGIFWTLTSVCILVFLGQDMAEKEFLSGYALAITTAIMTAIIGTASVIIDLILSMESDRSARSDDNLEQQQQKLRKFLEDMFPGFLELNDATITFESEGIASLSNANLGTLKQKKLMEFVHPLDIEMLQDNLNRHGDVGFRQELRLIDIHDHWIWFEVYGISGQQDHNWLLALRNFSDEYAQRQRRENEARLQSVGLLAAGIAHDFNNLLTVIVGFAERFPASDEKKQVIDAADKASELANRLVIFGEPDSGNTALNDLSSLITNWRPLLGSILGEEITFTCRNGDAPIWIEANEVQLQQILLNIVKNAKEAMPNGGAFTLSLDRLKLGSDNRFELPPAAYVLITMTDTGIGMSDETRNHMFDPYYSTKSTGTGRGLGLSSVYGILQQHQGAILIDTDQSIGTTICIALPEQPASSESNRFPNIVESIPASSGLKVLVVEDEEMIRALMKRVLEDEGYEVSLAKNGTEGLALYEAMARKAHILITDVVMPEMRGSELANRLRAHNPDLMVMFVSGYSARELGEFDLSTGNTVFLAKPFKMTDLTAQLRKLKVLDGQKNAGLTIEDTNTQ